MFILGTKLVVVSSSDHCRAGARVRVIVRIRSNVRVRLLGLPVDRALGLNFFTWFSLAATGLQGFRQSC